MSAEFSVDLPAPGTALAIGAHADDTEFGCGATLAKWSAAGASVHFLVLTDGSKGSWDPDADQAALVAERRREQEKAAAVLGIAEVLFLDLVDGELENGRAERARVCEVIRTVRPDVVLGHDPWARYRLHPDHRAAGFLVTDGIVAARDPHFFPDQAVGPHRPERLLLFEAEVPDHYEGVDAFLDAKVDALLCHRSQWRNTMEIDPDTPDADAQREAFAARVRADAAAAGAPAGLARAESFKLLTDL
ncbi:MAG: PIG-L deacetylase family protein [Acidimicrobiia bacterium]